ncbi:protein kinase [Streptomyces sp. ACA25]|uniref:serine/threonine protein kinase n=1 Tax=Streptomyces sp. ACA25 TaxID=3022596 RepID=UPI0023078EF0|nr:protein kinase [Streptomyces sp. ACA25]MDB1089439.1 protein kinase [Streptomyces sp. ACA25]
MSARATVRVPAGYRVGRWEVQEPLASGSFGSVYAARRTGNGEELPESAALKFLPTGTQTPRGLSHLRDIAEREVALLRRLRHPRLIRMYEVLTVEDPGRPELDGATVLVLERAETSLAVLLRQTGDDGGGPLPGAGPLLAQVCAGLAQLHQAGWVHGDLKPGNVLLMADGSVRLADFSLAAELDGTHAYAPLFTSGDYAPPELASEPVTERGRQTRTTADIWAFGVLAHLLLTGLHAFPGSTAAARREAMRRYAAGAEELRLSPALPAVWRPIVAGCLARTHEGRSGYSPMALLRQVEEAAGAERSPRLAAAPRRRWLTAAAGGVVLAALTAGVLLPRAGSEPPPYGADRLATDAGIPDGLRKLIVDTADVCDQEEVTPALIAALLKAESDFDADLHDPENDEFGIARWTPSVLYWWLPSEERPERDVPPEPPFPPEMSIPAVGRYLCHVSPRVRHDLEVDHQVALTLAHRSSWERVNEWGGVPEHLRDHAEEVARYLALYTPGG